MVQIIPRDRRDRLGEGLLWLPRENALYWTDILDAQLSRLDLDTGNVRNWAMPDTIGWVIERQEGGLVAGIGREIMLIDSLDPLTLTVIAAPEPDRLGNRLNDAKVDSKGRIWAGTMPRDGDRPSGALYRIDPDCGSLRIDDRYHIANGPAFSPDGEWLYHTDSALGLVYRFPFADEYLGEREIFIRFEKSWGKPDGMTCDSEGGLWIAHWGAGCVSRFTPEGMRDVVIILPTSQITNCVFAGENLDRMFVTSAHDGIDDSLAGHLFEIETGRRGMPPYLFGA